MRRWLLAGALAAGGAGCGPDCEPVIPAKELPFLGALDASAPGEIGLRAFRRATLERAGTQVPLVGGDPVVVRVLLPPNHCEGRLSLRLAQSVGPSDPPADQVLSLVTGESTTGVVLGTSEALRRTDDAVSLDTYAEAAGEKRVGPSATDHPVSFTVPAGVDVVTLVRSSTEVHESAVLGATFTTAPTGR